MRVDVRGSSLAGIEPMLVELSQLPAGPPEMSRVVEICGRYGITFPT